MRFIETRRDKRPAIPEGLRLNVASERKEYVVGVDVGQKKDHTAIAVVERSDVSYAERDPVTYAHYEKTEYRLRYLKRVELGLSYPQIVQKVDKAVQSLKQKCSFWGNLPLMSVVVDATGVGQAFVDLLHDVGLGCDLIPVSITAGEHETQMRSGWHVPKRDLVTALQVMYENDELLMSQGMAELDALVKELGEMQVRRSPSGHEAFAAWREGAHDDLVLAVALAVWKARKHRKSPWGKVWLV